MVNAPRVLQILVTVFRLGELIDPGISDVAEEGHEIQVLDVQDADPAIVAHQFFLKGVGVPIMPLIILAIAGIIGDF